MNDLNPDSDFTLVEGIKSNKRSAYDLFIGKYSKLIMHLCYQSSRNYEDAFEDCNEILYKIFSKIDQYNSSKSSFKTWITKITKYYLTDRYRQKSKSPELFSFEEFELDNTVGTHDELYDDAIETDFNQNDDQDISCLQKALLCLSERDQTIVKYRSEGFTNSEIAVFLNVREVVVKTAYHRALKKIEQKFLEEKKISNSSSI